MTTTSHQLSPEQQQLLEELAPFGVASSTTPCDQCKRALDYPLKHHPNIRLCCFCYPGGHIYGHDRHDRLIALFGPSRK